MRIPIVLPIFLLFAASCTSTQPPTDIVPPQLLYVHPLPVYPQPLPTGTLRIPVEISVNKEGMVSDVQWDCSSGISAWDSAAITAIRSWRYFPAQSHGTPVNIRVRQTVVVTFTDPCTMVLGEIICPTKEGADSARSALRTGTPFTEVAQQFHRQRDASHTGALGRVSLQIFPSVMKSEIQRLRIGQCTEPLAYGTWYVIYVRLPE